MFIIDVLYLIFLLSVGLRNTAVLPPLPPVALLKEMTFRPLINRETSDVDGKEVGNVPFLLESSGPPICFLTQRNPVCICLTNIQIHSIGGGGGFLFPLPQGWHVQPESHHAENKNKRQNLFIIVVLTIQRCNFSDRCISIR